MANNTDKAAKQLVNLLLQSRKKITDNGQSVTISGQGSEITIKYGNTQINKSSGVGL